MKPGQVHEPGEQWAEQNRRGKGTNFEASKRLPGGFPVFHILYGHSKGNGDVLWYNLHLPVSLHVNPSVLHLHILCNVQNFADISNLFIINNL